MHIKNVKRIAILLILAVICACAGYHFSYPIELDRATLPAHIQDFYNRGRSAASSPAVILYDGVSIGRKEYALIEIGEDLDLGSVTLERGLTGRYKITRLGYGGGSFLDGIVEGGGKKYLLFGGRDITSQISKITVRIDGLTYELYTGGAKDHFLLYTEIDSRVEDNHVNRDHIHFYNESGADITERYNLSGGGIP